MKNKLKDNDFNDEEIENFPKLVNVSITVSQYALSELIKELTNAFNLTEKLKKEYCGN